MNTDDMKVAANFKRLVLKCMGVQVDLIRFAKDGQYAKDTVAAALSVDDPELHMVALKLKAVLEDGGGNDPTGSGQGGGGAKKYVRSLR
jgi:hypothetical protein